MIYRKQTTPLRLMLSAAFAMAVATAGVALSDPVYAADSETSETLSPKSPTPPSDLPRSPDPEPESHANLPGSELPPAIEPIPAKPGLPPPPMPEPAAPHLAPPPPPMPQPAQPPPLSHRPDLNPANPGQPDPQELPPRSQSKPISHIYPMSSDKADNH